MNAIFKNYGLALSKYGDAFAFLFRHNLYWYFIFPLLFNVLLWYGGAIVIDSIFNTFNAWFVSIIGYNEWTFWGSSFFAGSISFIIKIIFKLAFFILYAFLGGYVILILMSPILAILSEKTEKIATGATYNINMVQFIKDVVRGVLIAVRNMFLEIGIYILVLLSTASISLVLLFIPIFGTVLIPVVSFIGTIYMFFVSSYFYGFSYMDYTSERRKLKLGDSILFIKNNKGIAMGNGSVFAFATLLPWCGNFFSSFFSIISVVAATLTIIELDKKQGYVVKKKE